MIIEDIKPIDKNGLPHGYWEEYYDTGLLWSKGYYIHGVIYGYWEYYIGGYLMYKGLYIHGKRYGYFEQYHSNGDLWYEGCFIHGKLLYLTSKNKFIL